MEIEEQMEILRISTCASLTQRELEDNYLKKHMKGIQITLLRPEIKRRSLSLLFNTETH